MYERGAGMFRRSWNRWMQMVTDQVKRWAGRHQRAAMICPGLACICAALLVAVLVLVIPDNSDAAGVSGRGNGNVTRENGLKIVEATDSTEDSEAAGSEDKYSGGVSDDEISVSVGGQSGHDGGQVTGSGAGMVDKSNLILVNPWNSLPEDYEVRLAKAENGHFVDERCADALAKMLEDCRAEGLSPYICSSYRTMEYQQKLFDDNIRQLMALGYSEEEATTETASCIATPGTSEHQLGLAVDIVDVNYQTLDEAQEDTEVQKWLMDNSWRYGFILRYPTDKSDVTGIIYEPWHYRYVGEAAAKEIYDQEVCLEEYLETLNIESK